MEYNKIFSPKTLEKLNKQSAENLRQMLGDKDLMQTVASSQQLLSQISKAEAPYKEQLEKLAIKMVKELYPIIDEEGIILDAKIVDMSDVNQSLDEVKINNPIIDRKFFNYILNKQIEINNPDWNKIASIILNHTKKVGFFDKWTVKDFTNIYKEIKPYLIDYKNLDEIKVNNPINYQYPLLINNLDSYNSWRDKASKDYFNKYKEMYDFIDANNNYEDWVNKHFQFPKNPKLKFPFYIKKGVTSDYVFSKDGNKSLSQILSQIKKLPQDKQIELRQLLKDKFNISEIKVNNPTEIKSPYIIKSQKDWDKLWPTLKQKGYIWISGKLLDSKMPWDPNNTVYINKKPDNRLSWSGDKYYPEELFESISPESRRRIINGITQGAALKGAFAFYLFKEHLDELDPSLVEKYNQIMKNSFGIYDDENAIAMILALLAQGHKMAGGSSKVIVNEIKINIPPGILNIEKDGTKYILDNGWYGLFNKDEDIVMFLASKEKDLKELELYLNQKNIPFELDKLSTGAIFYIKPKYFRIKDNLTEIKVNEPGKPILKFKGGDGGGTSEWILSNNLLHFRKNSNSQYNELRTEFIYNDDKEKNTNTINFLNKLNIPFEKKQGGGFNWLNIKEPEKYFRFDIEVDKYGTPLNESTQSDITIKARAICFPMLVHELIKGLYELISLQGFKGDKKQNQDVVDKVDLLKNEPYDIKYGKFIYEAINDVFANSGFDNPKLREFFFVEVYKLEDQKFLEFIENAINEELTPEQQKWVKITLREIEDDIKKDDYDKTGIGEIKINDPKDPQKILNAIKRDFRNTFKSYKSDLIQAYKNNNFTDDLINKIILAQKTFDRKWSSITGGGSEEFFGEWIKKIKDEDLPINSSGSYYTALQDEDWLNDLAEELGADDEEELSEIKINNPTINLEDVKKLWNAIVLDESDETNNQEIWMKGKAYLEKIAKRALIGETIFFIEKLTPKQFIEFYQILKQYNGNKVNEIKINKPGWPNLEIVTLDESDTYAFLEIHDPNSNKMWIGNWDSETPNYIYIYQGENDEARFKYLKSLLDKYGKKYKLYNLDDETFAQMNIPIDLFNLSKDRKFAK